jgi:hypothetical protein
VAGPPLLCGDGDGEGLGTLLALLLRLRPPDGVIDPVELESERIWPLSKGLVPGEIAGDERIGVDWPVFAK